MVVAIWVEVVRGGISMAMGGGMGLEAGITIIMVGTVAMGAITMETTWLQAEITTMVTI